MALLCKMSCDGLVSVRAVACGVGIGETWQGIVVACFDGLEPGVLDWEASTGMVEPHQRPNAWELTLRGSKGLPVFVVSTAIAIAWFAPYM